MDAPRLGRWRQARSAGAGAGAGAETTVRAGRAFRADAPEPLEGRALLSGMIADLGAAPHGATAAAAVVGRRDGALYYAEVGGTTAATPALGKVTAKGTQSEIKLPAADAGYAVQGVASDNAGNLWYTLAATPGATAAGSPAGKLGRVAADGSITEFALPRPTDVAGAATLGPDGNVWVEVETAHGWSIDRVGADGSVAEHPVAGATSLNWLTAGNDGELWFTDGPKVGKMTTAGAVTEFHLPAPADGSAIDLSDAQLTPGKDGDIYFLGLGGLSRITPAGVTNTLEANGLKVTALAEGTDGNLWYSFLPPKSGQLAALPGAVVARLASNGTTTVVPDRADAAGTPVQRLVTGLDASLWLETGGTKFGRVNLAGIPSYTPPTVTPLTHSAVTTDANKSYSGPVVSFTPNYGNARLTDFSATIDWGDGQTSKGTIAADPRGGYDVDGSHTYGSAVKPGSTHLTSVGIQGAVGALSTIYGVVQVAGGTTSTLPPLKSGTIIPTGAPGTAIIATNGATTPPTTATATATTPDTTTAAPTTSAGAVTHAVAGRHIHVAGWRLYRVAHPHGESVARLRLEAARAHRAAARALRQAH